MGKRLRPNRAHGRDESADASSRIGKRPRPNRTTPRANQKTRTARNGRATKAKFPKCLYLGISGQSNRKVSSLGRAQRFELGPAECFEIEPRTKLELSSFLKTLATIARVRHLRTGNFESLVGRSRRMLRNRTPYKARTKLIPENLSNNCSCTASRAELETLKVWSVGRAQGSNSAPKNASKSNPVQSSN